MKIRYSLATLGTIALAVGAPVAQASTAHTSTNLVKESKASAAKLAQENYWKAVNVFMASHYSVTTSLRPDDRAGIRGI